MIYTGASKTQHTGSSRQQAGKALVIEHREEVYTRLTTMLQIVGYTPDRIIRYLSPGEARMVGNEAIELIVTNALSEAFEQMQGKLPFIPVLYITDDLEVQVVINPLTTAEQDLVGKERSYAEKLLAAIQHATALRRIAKCMQQDEEKEEDVENILESITGGVFAVNRKWRFTHINQQFEYYFKKDKRSLLGRSIWKTFPHSKNARFYKECHRALAEQVSVQFEEYNPGLNTWISVKAYPAKDSLTVYFADITEQKKIQEELAGMNKDLAAMVNNTRDIIWTVDTKGNIISANDAFWARVARITGGQSEVVTKEDFDRHLFETWQQYYKKALTGAAYSTTWTETNEDKTTYEEVCFNPMYDLKGNVTGLSCFSRDITEQQLHIETIEKQNEQFRKIAWAQSHEFRAPVASILGLVELYNNEAPCDPLNTEILAKVKEAAENLDETIRKINTYTRTKHKTSLPEKKL